MSESSRQNPAKQRRSLNPVGIVISILLIANTIYFISFFSDHMDRVAWQQCFFRLHFRYWPMECSYILWSVLIWLLIDAATFRHRHRPFVDERGNANTVRILVLLFKSLVVLAFLFPTLKTIRLNVIRTLLMEYYYIPMTHFFSGGTLSWKLALPPMTAIFAIGFLLYLNKRLNGKKIFSHRTS